MSLTKSVPLTPSLDLTVGTFALPGSVIPNKGEGVPVSVDTFYPPLKSEATIDSAPKGACSLLIITY